MKKAHHLQHAVFNGVVLWLLATACAGAGSNAVGMVQQTGTNAAVTPQQFLDSSFDVTVTNIEIPLGLGFGTTNLYGLQISLGTNHETAIEFSRGTNSHVFPLKPKLYYSDPIVSANGRTVFFLVRQYQAVGRDNKIHRIDMSYHGLERFDLPEKTAPLSGAKRQLVLTAPKLQSLLGGRRAWVRALEEISPDGTRLRLNLAVEDKTVAAQRIEYPHRTYWYYVAENRLSEVPDSP